MISDQNFLYSSLPHKIHALPISSPRLDHSSNIWQGVQVMKLHITDFLQCPIISFLLGPNIPFSARSQTLSIYVLPLA
jgi:hypothetical protein